MIPSASFQEGNPSRLWDDSGIEHMNMKIRNLMILCGVTGLIFAGEVPKALVWQFNDRSLSRRQYLKDIDFISRNIDVDVLAIAPLENVNVEDSGQFHDAFKELVEYASSKSIRVVLRQEPGMSGFFNASVDGSDEGTFVIADQTEAQGVAYDDETVLDDEGFAEVKVSAKWARNKLRPLRNELLRVYAFDRTGAGFYRPGSLTDITGKARVVARTSRAQTIEIEAGTEYAGKNVFVLTCQYFNYRDLFGGAFARQQKKIMDSLRDVPLAGFYLDESGYMVLDSRRIRRGETSPWRGRFYSAAMEREWRSKHGTDLVRTLFDMRYAPEGDDRARIRAINLYMETMRMKPLEVERELVAYQKRIWGDDVFLACHSTFHNKLDGDEVWHTGCDWWDVPRDFGFTDERTDYPTRMGVLLSSKKSMLLHMYYSKNAEDYYREMIGMAPFNGRVFQHAYNDGVWGLGFNETETTFLPDIRKLTRVISSLDTFQNVCPRLDLLVVFGTAAQFNWYPDHDARNKWDVDGSLGIQNKMRALWEAGYRCALIPDTMITDGRLGISDGRFVFNGHEFRHCLFLYPKYAKKEVYGFLNRAAAEGMSLAVAGRADIDFDADPVRFRGKAYESYSDSILVDMGVPKTGIKGGAVLSDGSFALASRGIIDGSVTEFGFDVDGVRYTGSHTGLLAYRKGGAMFGTEGSVLFRDGVPVKLASPEAVVEERK